MEALGFKPRPESDKRARITTRRERTPTTRPDSPSAVNPEVFGVLGLGVGVVEVRGGCLRRSFGTRGGDSLLLCGTRGGCAFSKRRPLSSRAFVRSFRQCEPRSAGC